MKIPTFKELADTYSEIAVIERLKCGIPCEGTVKNAVSALGYIVGEKMEEPISKLTRRRIDDYIVSTLNRGISPVTVWGYVEQLRALSARWTRPYYRDRGLKVMPFDLPCRKKKAPRYIRPERDKLLKVKDWYESLPLREDKRYRMVATMMLEFAMRNGDIERLKWSDFREKNGVTLCYTPHKTSLSSGRIVCWPVHPEIWREFLSYKPKAECSLHQPFVEHVRGVFRKLNAELRSMGFKGSKGCYELRKICIDHIYQKYGAEMASSISGDDIRTVTRYYADPSAVTVMGMKVVDLL